MFDAIKEILSKCWDQAIFVRILCDYEVGVIYRAGAYHRKMNIGFNWKIPFIEEYKQVSRQDDTKQLKVQTFNSSSGKHRTVIPCVCFYISNAQKYFKNVLSSEDSIVEDMVAGLVAQYIRENKDVYSKEFLREVRDDCGTYGYKVRDITFVTDASIPAQRIILDKDITVE